MDTYFRLGGFPESGLNLILINIANSQPNVKR
jgi:hypothetical protein